jgi:hypothetical protein
MLGITGVIPPWGKLYKENHPDAPPYPEACFFAFLQPEKQSFSAASRQKKAPQNAGRV